MAQREALAATSVAAAARLVADISMEAARIDGDGGPPAIALQRLHEAGLLSAPLLEAGPSLTEVECRLALLRVLAHIGRGSLPVGRLYEGHVNALALVRAFGTAEQMARAAADAANGALFGVWNTQGEDGVVLTAADAGGCHALSGSKTFASGAGFVGRAVVTARDATGRWQMVLVDTGNASLSIDRRFWKPLGMKPSASFKVAFDGTSVAADALLGVADDYFREPDFSTGAVRFAAVQVGGIEAVFDETRAFLRSLGRCDDPFQQARLGEMAMLMAGARQWLQGAALNTVSLPAAAAEATAMAIEPPSAHDACIAYAHLMRSAVEDIALRVMRLSERCVGARGLVQPAPFERLHRDLTHYLRQAAPDAAITRAGAHVLARGEAAHDLWNE